MRAEARRNLGTRLVFWLALWFVAAWAVAVWVETSLGHEVEVALAGVETAIGMCLLWAFWIARFRLSSTLQREWLKQRLVPILLSRLSPEEVAALSGAPAVLLGLLVSALSLPAWALGVGLGFLTLLDAWGWALLLAAACIGFPSWSTGAWEAQLNARTQNKSAASAKGGARKTASSSTASTGVSAATAPFLSLLPIGIALFCVAPQPLASSFETWVAMWPGEITMLWSHAYAFPLLLARLLVYPLPFFAASLPLWIALAPFWVSALRVSHANLSCALEARRDSDQKRARRVAAIWRPVRGWWAPLLAGFALPVAYRSGWLAAWRGSTPMFPSPWGVESDVTLSWWHIVVAVGTLALSLWLRTGAANCATGSLTWAELRERFKRLAQRFGAGVLGAGILGPSLCGHNPLPAPLALFGVQMALVVATWLLIQTALARESSMGGQGAEQFPQRVVFRRLVPLWMVGVPMLIAGVPFALSWGTVFVSPLAWPFCLASPSTLWFAPRFEFSLWSPLFYGCALLHLALAGLLCWHAHTLRVPVAGGTRTKTKRQVKAQKRALLKQSALQTRAQSTAAAPMVDAPQQTLAEARRATVAALVMVLEARQRPEARPTRVKSRDGDAPVDDSPEINAPQTAALRTATRLPIPTPTPQQEQFLSRFARDNALLRLELRRAMGKIEWVGSARENSKVGAGVIVFFSIFFPAIFFVFSLLSPPRRPGSGLTFTDMEWLYCAITAVGILLTCVDVCQKTPALYDRDRLDGSLEFLFLTPLQTREIVAGKTGPPLLRGSCFLAAFWPSLFTIALLLSLGGDHRLWFFAGILPVVAWALTARAVAWLHLVGVAKPSSKPVYFAAIGGFCALPLLLFVGALVVSDASSSSPWDNPAPLALLLLLLIPLCLLDCLGPLFWSVRVLERERVPR